jgi:pimeloyl-ACP methyl ester carboxylesterase
MRSSRQICLLSLLVTITAAYAQESLTFEDMSFTAACDGTKQFYVLGLPPAFNKDESHDLLIALHGHGSDRWRFPRDNRDEFRAARDVAVKHRMIFVAPDYRAKTSWMGPKAEADVVQIIGDLKKQYHVGRVIVSGASMGGSSALTFAAMHPELTDGVASINGTANHLEYENFQDAIRESFGGTKAEIPAEYKKRSAEYWPERLTMPIGIVVSSNDKVVPPDSAMRLASILKKINTPVLLIIEENQGHRAGYDATMRAYEFAINPKAVASVPAP